MVVQSAFTVQTTLLIFMLGSFISLAENQSSIALLSWQRGNSLIGNPIGAHFSLDLLHMTRTANPHADMLLLLQSQQVLDSNPAYAKRLQEIGVSVHFRENLTSPGSRSAKYARLHAAANFQGMPDMESRFCEWADLALLYKLDRVLTLDSDAAAFEDVNQVFQNYTEDIISPCSQCSQVVLWRTSALSHFCDAYIEYVSDLLGGNNTFHQFYGTGTYFNDMAFLNIYVHERWLKVNNESYAFLTENASVSPRNPNPRAWFPGISAMIFHTAYIQSKTFEKPGPQPRNWWSDMPEGNCTINNGCCPNYTDNMKWQARKPGSLEGGIPSLPDGTLIPIIHFHSYCKIMVVHETFLRFWPVQPDLTVLPLPFLQLSSSAANNDGWNGSYWVFIQAFILIVVPTLLIFGILVWRWAPLRERDSSSDSLQT